MVGSPMGDALYTASQIDIYPSCPPPPYELACHASGDLPYDPNRSKYSLGLSSSFHSALVLSLLLNKILFETIKTVIKDFIRFPPF